MARKFPHFLIFILLAGSFNKLAYSNTLDTIPLYKDVPVIIPFEFKQSTLNYESTFRRIDSVAKTLLANDSILLSVQGYAHPDEGSDDICYWLSYNRALAVKSYLNGRGIDSIRIWSFLCRLLYLLKILMEMVLLMKMINVPMNLVTLIWMDARTRMLS